MNLSHETLAPLVGKTVTVTRNDVPGSWTGVLDNVWGDGVLHIIPSFIHLITGGEANRHFIVAYLIGCMGVVLGFVVRGSWFGERLKSASVMRRREGSHERVEQ